MWLHELLTLAVASHGAPLSSPLRDAVHWISKHTPLLVIRGPMDRTGR